MKAGTYYVQHGYRPGVQRGYRLCTYCFERGVKARATHVIVHPWWKFRWSDAVCDGCADPINHSTPASEKP
jgi:hypothetical protein